MPCRYIGLAIAHAFFFLLALGATKLKNMLFGIILEEEEEEKGSEDDQLVEDML